MNITQKHHTRFSSFTHLENQTNSSFKADNFDLSEVFDLVRPAIVAFAWDAATTAQMGKRLLPRILGTGFFVDDRGLVATNRHVVDVRRGLPRNPVTDSSSAIALVFPSVEDVEGNQAIGVAPVTIREYWPLETFEKPESYYGDPLPDVAFVQLNIRGVPALQLALEPWTVRIGTRIATAGFPLGEDPLTVYGTINQVTPVLRHGIVSSVFPSPCPRPHGFTVDILTQGGASGSPIFLAQSPAIIGMVHAGFGNTNFTYAVPAEILSGALETLLTSHQVDFGNPITLQELVGTREPR
jgi:S1-C subfamily serine protease